MHLHGLSREHVLRGVIGHKGTGPLMYALFVAFAGGQEMIFDASSSAREILNKDDCETRRYNGDRYLMLAPDTNPYTKNEMELRLDFDGITGTDDSFVLELQFLDIGAGVIQPRVLENEDAKFESPARQSNYTRLNTRTLSSAYFAFQAPTVRLAREGGTEQAHLRIAGIQYLRAIVFHDDFSEAQWREADASIPVDVKPMVTLQRPMDLVTTAGISVLGGAENLTADLANMRELAPLAKVLGFNAIEMYVRWNVIEPQREGEFDFNYYDALAAELQRYGLKWFPLLIIGSAYALPQWFLDSGENSGFVCLEHDIANDIQSIWGPNQRRHVTRVLQAFGSHYEPMKTLSGVRLGPSGNYGESQYPAGGNWPVKGRNMHIHIGLWCADEYARTNLRETLRAKYGEVTKLNSAWSTTYMDFSGINPQFPEAIASMRHRADQAQWYSDSMSNWCEWWGIEARQAMPNTPIYQSAGGWGFHEAGTDYSAQAKSMTLIGGGIRLTNETDSYEQNFYATRLAATAARLYGVPLGYEPASSHTARGVVGRIFNTIATNGDHLFTYHSNLFYHPMAIDKWIEYLPLLDRCAEPLVEVAVYYPETFNQLDDSAFRHLYASGFNSRAAAVRRVIDVDYLDDRLIRDGFLDRYKALVFVWGDVIEADVQQRIDKWIRRGGTAIYPSFPRGAQSTVEGDPTVFRRWTSGDTGDGRFVRFPGDMEPTSLYADFVRETLPDLESLDSATRIALSASHPEGVFLTAQKDGHLLTLNYTDDEARVRVARGNTITIGPYDIVQTNVGTSDSHHQ